jgi:two-component system response regulator NreC
LSAKERDVLRLLVLGHTNSEIAALSPVSPVSLRTVEARRARILQKPGVRTRAELVRVAQRLGNTDFEHA